MSVHAWLDGHRQKPTSPAKECRLCGALVPYSGRGQPPKYCPEPCRAEAQRQQQRDKWKRHGAKYNRNRRKSGKETTDGQANA